MKVTCVLGSPRKKGFSATVAREFLSELRKKGETQIREFHLNSLSYRGCQACYRCNQDLDRCALTDDLNEVLEEVRTTDLLVISSSVFYGDVTGQTKTFIDRMYSFVRYDFEKEEFTSRLANKSLLMILTQGNSDSNLFNDIYPRYSFFFSVGGFSDIRLIRGCGLNPVPGALETSDVLEQAREAARYFGNSLEKAKKEPTNIKPISLESLSRNSA